MIRHIREWWEHVGYSWNKVSPRGFRTFGLRPWKSAPFFWFIVDTSNTAKRVPRADQFTSPAAAPKEKP